MASNLINKTIENIKNEEEQQAVEEVKKSQQEQAKSNT